MTEFDSRHSRRVAWLKVVFPLIALTLLSALFLVSGPRDTAAKLPMADDELTRITKDRRVENPSFAGVSPAGTAVNVSARSARIDMDATERMDANDLRAQIETPDGGSITLRAAHGVVDSDAKVAIMDGGVSLESSTGYAVTTNRLQTSWESGQVFSADSVTGSGPPGRFRADRIELKMTANGQYVLSFTGRVSLLYDPNPKAE